MEMLHVVVVLVSLASCCWAYGTAPPVATKAGLCDSMLPQHGATAKTTPAPVRIVLSNTCYKAGQTIKVTVERKGSGDPIEGLFVQLRKTTGSNLKRSLGTFKPISYKVQALNCHGMQNNALGHKNVIKEPSVEFAWKAPANAGDVSFVATVVVKKQVFWMNVKSEVLKYDNACVPQSFQSGGATSVQVATFLFIGTLLAAVYHIL